MATIAETKREFGVLTLEREGLDGRLARRGLCLGSRRDEDTRLGELLDEEFIEHN